MRKSPSAAALGLAALLLGCQSMPPPPPEVEAASLDGPTPALAARLRSEFLAKDDFAASLERLMELEGQALELLEYEPLKLGAIGSAMLDMNYANLSGHYALQTFYSHVEAAAAEAHHAAWAAATKAAMASAGSGAPDSPYSAITPAEAQFYLRSEALSAVGAIYKSNEDTPFMLLALGRSSNKGPLRQLHFALNGLAQIAERQFKGNGAEGEFSPLTMIGGLARQGDAAAQTALGALLATRNRVDDAIGWLQAASRVDNVIAHNILARIHTVQYSQAQSPEERQAALENVLENYMRATALGSPNAMYGLAALYLEGVFGADNLSAGIPLMRQAGDLGNSDALLHLAYLHYAGKEVEQDRDAAEAYFVRAAALKNDAARLGYARYLMRERAAPDRSGQAIAWLTEMVRETANPEAMLMLGSLHARGVATKQNFRTARKWYRDAARAAPEQADIVNEVAWTLTVSDLKRLRQARFANRIMTRLMQQDQDAQNRPEYLDTWAATYAATGNFREAVRVQELALQEAVDTDRKDVLDILQQHLDLFLAGKPVIEQVP